jgi:hypothetical protein
MNHNLFFKRNNLLLGLLPDNISDKLKTEILYQAAIQEKEDSIVITISTNKIVNLKSHLRKMGKVMGFVGVANIDGWKLEEIAKCVLLGSFEMEKLYGHLYNENIKKFELALTNEDYDAAKEARDAVTDVINPYSTLHKMTEIQMIGLRKKDKKENG